MTTIKTKIIPGAEPGTYVEAEGTLVDLVNPLVPSATTGGQLVKVGVVALAVKLLTS